MSPLDHAEDLAKELANNWKRFGSYSRREALPDGFAVVYTSNRDSGPLDRSNARVIAKALAPYTNGDDPDVRDESSSHWAVGHVDGFAIRVYDANGAITPAFAAYAEMVEAMADYSILDEHDFSNEEMEEANQVWANCYRPAERLEYIRDHRSQFEFHDWQDLLANIRGHYFSGYASEMCGS